MKHLKSNLDLLVTYLIIGVGVYLGVSFVMWESSPALWSLEARVSAVAIYWLLSSVLTAVYAISKG